MTKNNSTFEEMRRIGHDWEAKRAAHQARKQDIINEYGWNSEELKAWYAEKEAHTFPFTQGQSKAWRAWAESIARNQDELEMADFLFDTEVEDFIRTLEAAGITSMVYTNTSTAVMENIHAFDALGWKLACLCRITRRENRWGEEEEYEVQGIRFEKK